METLISKLCLVELAVRGSFVLSTRFAKYFNRETPFDGVPDKEKDMVLAEILSYPLDVISEDQFASIIYTANKECNKKLDARKIYNDFCFMPIKSILAYYIDGKESIFTGR